MIQKILDPDFLRVALVATAIATPLLSFILYRGRVTHYSRRMAIVIGLIGPFAFGYWFFHQFILETIGFDSIYSALIVMGVAIIIGSIAGMWVGMENHGARGGRVSVPASDPTHPESPPPQD
ncbi:hypothetical protein IT570_10445 [Candidatus Sumerlaeota bacterium]|nr:hypothetical protein [Candidatus Sumerlaeota bacterium]